VPDSSPFADYPSARAYLAGLPDGRRSYPSCEVSLELVMGLRERGALDGLDALTASLEDDGSGWVPEVVFTAVLLVVKDVRFVGPDPEHAMISWIEAMNRRMVVASSGPVFGGPSLALVHAPRVWARFHRGTEMEIRHLEETRAEVILRHPPGLWPSLVHEWRRRTFLAALASEGAALPSATCVRVAEGSQFSLVW
jgi:hypothetical protein